MTDIQKLLANVDAEKDPVGALKTCVQVFDLIEAQQRLNHQMDVGAGGGAMGRFAELQGDSESGQQALADALALTGLPVDIEVVDSADMPNDVPMRYSLLDHEIEINTNILQTRAEAAQAMAEELLHSVDHTGNGSTLSAGSYRMSLLRGDLSQEAIKHYGRNGYFAEFLDYPLGEKYERKLTQDRIRAELFARLGVLYLAQPDAVKQELPLAYEVFHECFGLSRESPVSDLYVRGKIWGGGARGYSQIRLHVRQAPSDEGRNAAGYRQQPANHGLAALRATLAKLLDSPSNGRKARL